MYVTKDGHTQKINDDTYPYWKTLGWSIDDDNDGVTDAGGASSSAVRRRSVPDYWVEAFAGTTTSFATFDSSFTAPSTSVHNHQLAIDCSDLRLVLPWGWTLNNTTTSIELLSAAGFPVKASLQIGTAVYPITFNGPRAATCDPSGRLISDPITGLFLKGTQVKARVLIGTISGGQYPVTRTTTGPGIAPAYTGGGYTKNADLTDVNTAPSSADASATLFGCALMGRPLAANPFVLAAVGDSIGEGQGDTGGTGYSWVTRATAANAPLFRITKPGAYAQAMAALPSYSLPMVGGASHAVVMLGTNDLLNTTRTVAQITGDLTTIYRMCLAEGAKVVGCTLPPRTSSTDAYATTGNQTVAGQGFTGGASSKRSQINAWIRAGGGGYLSGHIETADACETSRDSGLWRVDLGAPTTDGIHPSSVIHAAMAAAVDLAALAALPAAPLAA